MKTPVQKFTNAVDLSHQGMGDETMMVLARPIAELPGITVRPPTFSIVLSRDNSLNHREVSWLGPTTRASKDEVQELYTTSRVGPNPKASHQPWAQLQH